MSLLFMTILIVLSFAVNVMILNEIRSEHNFLQGVKAYYSAEAGVEDGLLQVSLHNAGESIAPQGNVDFVADAYTVAPSAFDEDDVNDVLQNTYSYTVASRGAMNPCLFESQTEQGYAKLEAGESVMIPLTDNDFFQVEYYVVNTEYPYDTPNNNPSFVMQNDVLRWKILGNRVNGEHVGKVEGISEYIPVYGVNFNAPNSPSAFGTHAFNGQVEYQRGKYYDILDGVTFDTADSVYLEDSAFSDNFAEGGFHYVYHPQYEIQSFLGEHTNNVLMLTNYLNVIPPTNSEVELIYDANDYDLYYRIHDSGSNRNDIACSAVQVSANGVSEDGTFRQSIDVIRPVDQASPVTDFVWYQREL